MGSSKLEVRHGREVDSRSCRLPDIRRQETTGVDARLLPLFKHFSARVKQDISQIDRITVRRRRSLLSI